MTSEEIASLIMQYLPQVLAIVTMVITTWKNLRDNGVTMKTLSDKLVSRIQETLEELKKANEMREIKGQLQIVVEENRKLRKQITKLIETYSRVKQDDEEV